jgi:hypothetical protein
MTEADVNNNSIIINNCLRHADVARDPELLYFILLDPGPGTVSHGHSNHTMRFSLISVARRLLLLLGAWKPRMRRDVILFVHW